MQRGGDTDTRGCRLWLLSVPPPRTFEQVRAMVTDGGYARCYAVSNALSPSLAAIFCAHGNDEGPVAVLMPARLENPWFHSRILPLARAVVFITGSLRPSEGARPVWSGTALVIFDRDDAHFDRFIRHPWFSRHSVPVESLDVASLRSPPTVHAAD